MANNRMTSDEKVAKLEGQIEALSCTVNQLWGRLMQLEKATGIWCASIEKRLPREKK